MATIKKRNKNGYLGNERLRAAGTVIDLEQWQLDEIRKCRKDYIYFIENYFYISSLDDGEILFKMWEPQKEFIHTIHKNRRVIGMQSRQTGKALHIETPIITPNGFVKLGDLDVGDVNIS